METKPEQHLQEGHSVNITEMLDKVGETTEQDLTDEMRAALDRDAALIAESIISIADAVGTIAHPEVREAVLDAVARYTALVVMATSNAARIDVTVAVDKLLAEQNL